jgi:hypothetical protein
MTGAGDPRVAYCSVEDVRDALDLQPGSRAARRIPRAIYGSSTSIEGLLNRRFYPCTDVRWFDWPINYQYAMPWRLWLDNHEVLSVDSIATGGRTLVPDVDFILRPENTGPPYSHIEIRLSSGSMWASGSGTWQQAIGVNGVFGGCDDTEPAGTLAAAVTDTTGTTVTVSDSAAVGTLDSIRVGTEWTTVTSKGMTSTGTLAADLASSKGQTLATPTGSTWHVGETLLIDAERLRVVDTAGANLVVERATDGSVLAAHTTGAVIYTPRALTVTRGVLGSTAATHLTAAPVARLAVPELIRNLAIAQAITNLQQDSAGWQTDHSKEARITDAVAINDLRNEAYTRWARQSRIRAV